MSLSDWDSRTQHIDIENNKTASPDDHDIPISLRTNSVPKMRKSKSRGRIARKLNFSKPKSKKESICNEVNCSIQGGRRRTKRRRRKRTKRRRRKRRKTRRKKRTKRR